MHVEALEPRHLLALMPQLLLDLTPGPDDSDIWHVVDVEGTTFFTVEPAQIWKTDGTTGGTVLVKDLAPSSGRRYLYLHNHNGILVFAMKDTGTNWGSDDDRVQLWQSDGTTAGTVLVKDFGLGSSWSMSLGAYLTTVDDALFAVVGDVDGGNELWKSDLTESGTVRVKDIRPGPYGSNPGALANLNGTLYFSADDGDHGMELWKSDGTESGTVLVKDIYPGPYGSGPFWLTPVDGELLFSAGDGANGVELWKSDGTTAGTVMVKDIRPGPASSNIMGPVLDMYMESLDFVALGGQVFFFADDGAHGQELWKSDGTELGTEMVKDVLPGSVSGVNSIFLENADGTLFFDGNDEMHGEELWKSDGMEAGTVLVADIRPGSVGSYPIWLSSAGGELFFAAVDETHGQELWRSDGTEAGTVLIADIYPGSAGSYPMLFPTTSATLFLTADDAIHGTEPFVMAVAGQIRGQKFKDVDGDGRRDPDEPGLDGFTIQLLDPETGDVLQSAVTASEELDGTPGIDPITERGLYRFEVAPGTYRIHELPQDGWLQSGPLSGDYLVTVAAGQVVGTAPAEAPVSAGPGTNWLDEVEAAGNVQFYTTVIVDVDIDLDGTRDAVFDLSGMTNVELSAAYDTGGDGIGDTVDTEITLLDLHGTALVGPTDVRLRPNPRSLGTAYQSPGGTLADTSFDVYLEIDTQGIFGQPLTLHNEDALPVQSLIDRVPPYGAVFSDTLSEPLLLYDEGGWAWAQLLGVTLLPLYGVDFGNREFRTLIVTQFIPNSSGFEVLFNRPVEPGVLNLYDDALQTLGPADVTVTGATQGAVRGSLVMSADQRQITFVRSGGLLEPDTYTVTLFSGATRFRQPTGGTLDGNGDETPGDNYQTTFTVSGLAAGTVTIRVPDLARGAGQPVNVPNAAAGLPIRLSDATGLTSLAVDFVYDAALLNITAAALAAGVPTDWSVTLDTATPGVAKIRAFGTTALSGTNVDVVRLTAAVPSTAPYGAVQAIRVDNVSLNNGALAAVGDVAVHKGVYLGDADGSGIHSSADAFLTVQAALGLASGFAAHPWTDPRIVGDADGSGVLSAADAFLIVQEGLGLAEPFVPDNPHITVTPVGGGVDPQFRIGMDLPANVGGLVTVPVNLAIEAAATNVGGIDFDLYFDPLQLAIQLPDGVSAGADTARGWAISSTLVAAGHLRVGMVSSRGQPLLPGLREIVRVQFHVGASLRDSLPVWEIPGIVDASFRDAVPVSERPGYVVALDIDPVDAQAGGYAWTARDGSVLIAVPNARHNRANLFGVNGDGAVLPVDAPTTIQYLHGQSSRVGLAAADDGGVSDACRDRLFAGQETNWWWLEEAISDLLSV